MAIVSPRASVRTFHNVQRSLYGDWSGMIARGELGEALRQVIEWSQSNAEIMHSAMLGKLNVTGTVTLTANQATTTLIDPRIGVDTVVVLTPTTANAAAEVGTLYQTYPNATAEQAVLNHANNAQADRTFAFTLIG